VSKHSDSKYKSWLQTACFRQVRLMAD